MPETPRFVKVGNLYDITPERVRDIRAKLDGARRNRDVYDAKTGELTPGGGELAPVNPVTSLIDRVKWQTWLALAAGVLFGLLVAVFGWWWNSSAKAERKEKARAADRRAERKALQG